MATWLEKEILERIQQLADVSEVDYSLFDYTTRNFKNDVPPPFCRGCTASGEHCNPRYVHTYGCFEAERWNGLYVYYCPIGLIYIASIVKEGKSPAFSIIAGPIVIGSTADVLNDNGGKMIEEILELPPFPASKVTSLSRVQEAVSLFLSGEAAKETEVSYQAQSDLLNSLYDVSLTMQENKDYSYSLSLERELEHMIVKGDKEGSQELINELLGHIYFQSNGNFEIIKERAKALIALFSRASIEGGADVKQIFGENDDILMEISTFETLDELSLFLTTIFHRFVSYVFDFNQVKHSDIIHKVINYIRQNYTEKITLDDVANVVYLSSSYLSKIFKEEMGCSFTYYVNTQRIEQSKDLLLNHTMSLADIATLVGFSDQSYFSKVFGRIVGITPQQYRKNRGNISEEDKK